MHPLNHSINATGCPEFIAGRAPHTTSEVGEDLMLERALRPRAVESVGVPLSPKITKKLSLLLSKTTFFSFSKKHVKFRSFTF